MLKKTIILFALVLSVEFAVADGLYAFCGTGDNLWNTNTEPVDSLNTIDGMMEWMNRSYGISRMYWRAIQGLQPEETRLFSTEPSVLGWLDWVEYQQKKRQSDKSAVRVAKKYGMEVFLYLGLFEHGVQPDAQNSYQFESIFRMNHPEWCGIDRWGERREPGISFTNPETRAEMVRKYLEQIEEFGYDGINFYTYVENYAIRFNHEFGFEPAVMQMFKEAFPAVDLRKDRLTTQQEEYWYKCRGHFVTLFLRELSAALRTKGKKLSICIDSDEPQYNQPWWGMPIRGNGKVHFDYQAWIREGIVDEIWVQLASPTNQKKLLDELIPLTRGTKVRLTLRTPDPLGEQWEPYRKQGVTAIAVITWVKNGIERYTPRQTDENMLEDSDWINRAQTLRDIASGKLQVDPQKYLSLQNDPMVLVRRNFYPALGKAAQQDPALIPVIEKGLKDPENSVRISSVKSLAQAHRPESLEAIFTALEKTPNFQFTMQTVTTLLAFDAGIKDKLLAGLSAKAPAVREACVRTLYQFVNKEKIDANEVFMPILSLLHAKNETATNKIWSITRLTGMRMKLSENNQQQLIAALCDLVEK